MNLNVSKRKDGRIYLYLEKSYRDKATGMTRHTLVQSLGYVDELEKQYPDPIAHFKEEARRRTLEEKAKRQTVLKIDLEESLSPQSEGMKNLGYAVPLKVYHELGIDDFLKNRARSELFEFNPNSIMILLMISRLLSPGSKKKAYEE